MSIRRFRKTFRAKQNSFLFYIFFVETVEDEDYIAYSTEKPAKKTEQELEEEYFNRTIVQKFETVYYPCDKKSNLYLLQQERFLKGNPPPSKGPATKSSYSRYGFVSLLEPPFNFIYCISSFILFCRPFYFKRIPHSNLLMVIIDTGFQTKNIVLKASPEKIVYDVDFPCHKLELNKLECRRLDECYTEHPDVSDCVVFIYSHTAIITAHIR